MGLVWIVIATAVIVLVCAFTLPNLNQNPAFQSQSESEQPQTVDSTPGVRHNTGVLDSYRSKYLAMYRFVSIPPNTASVMKLASVFCLAETYIWHYFWATRHNLFFFPQWEHLEQLLQLPENIGNLHPSYENNLQSIAIPIDKVLYYYLEQGENSSFVALMYRNAAGYDEISLFSGNTYPLFHRQMPDKELQCFLHRQYGKSSQNIYDIRQQMEQLEQLRSAQAISEEEYTEKKHQIIISM